jgi:hypothetical protein
MKIYVLFLILLMSSQILFAKEVKQDSTAEKISFLYKDIVKLIAITRHDSSQNEKQKFIPTPKKAALYAALIPAGGQFYNRDYWKVPVVLAALAAGTWTAIYWRVRYKDFVAGYFSFYDFSYPDSSSYGTLKAGLTADSPLPVFYRGGILNGKRNEARLYNINQVKQTKDMYRRYFETSIVVTAAIYALAIIEANVAAHLKTFDVSDDLTLRIEPKFSQPFLKQATPGIRLVLAFH